MNKEIDNIKIRKALNKIYQYEGDALLYADDKLLEILQDLEKTLKGDDKDEWYSNIINNNGINNTSFNIFYIFVFCKISKLENDIFYLQIRLIGKDIEDNANLKIRLMGNDIGDE